MAAIRNTTPAEESSGNTLRSESSGKRMDVADCGEAIRGLWALRRNCLNSRLIVREIPHGSRSKLTFITSSLAGVRRVRAWSQCREVTFHLSRIRCSSRRNISASGLRWPGLRSAYSLVAVPTHTWQTPRVRCTLRYSPRAYSMIIAQQLNRAGHFVPSARITNSENCVVPCDTDVHLETYK